MYTTSYYPTSRASIAARALDSRGLVRCCRTIAAPPLAHTCPHATRTPAPLPGKSLWVPYQSRCAQRGGASRLLQTNHCGPRQTNHCGPLARQITVAPLPANHCGHGVDPLLRRCQTPCKSQRATRLLAPIQSTATTLPHTSLPPSHTNQCLRNLADRVASAFVLHQCGELSQRLGRLLHSRIPACG